MSSNAGGEMQSDRIQASMLDAVRKVMLTWLSY